MDKEIINLTVTLKEAFIIIIGSLKEIRGTCV